MPVQSLVITGVGFPPASIRGVSQSLNPIAEGINVARLANGGIVSLSPPQFKKYRSIISCSDQLPPALDGIWIGQIVTVDCVAKLSYLTTGGAPARPVVSSYVEGVFTFYYPRLEMMIVGFSVDRDEWQEVVGWSIELEEM